MSHDDYPTGPYASPACAAHELDELYRDQAPPDAETRRDVMRWRRAERERLYRLRRELPAEARAAAESELRARLDDLVAARGARVIGGYWPIRGEPDLRPWLAAADARGLAVALPVVVAADRPLRYSRWRPGAEMRRGRWGIAEPAVDDWLEPGLVVAPLLGVDARNYRLGNGGGYFDRTLGAARPRPFAVGVGFGCARIETIYPLPHDVPMDAVVIDG